MNETSLRVSGHVACGRNFRDHYSPSLAVCRIYGENYALHAKVIGVMKTIEIAFENNWRHLWMETNSKLISLTYNNNNIIPKKLKNRSLNCIYKINV